MVVDCKSDCYIKWNAGGNKGTTLTRVRWDAAENSDESERESSVEGFYLKFDRFHHALVEVYTTDIGVPFGR
jgi:hypothetical protein